MKKYAYWLSNIKGLGTAKKNALYKMGFTAEETYSMSENRLYSISLLKKEEADAILSSKTSWNLEKAWFTLMEKGIGFVSIEDDEFPSRLRDIPMAPYSLY
ncbi:MAG: DNA-protecting protein DprA, partial [Agathobacter sp.]|nr:DNA-protecting protein DprA [Agathobacter sp.]